MQFVAVFPEFAAPVVFPVIVLRVSLGQQLHEVDHSRFTAWKDQEVSMARHQAIPNYGDMVSLC